MIVQELNLIQREHGHLKKEELQKLSQRAGVPLRRLHEVASFYPLYRLEPFEGADVRVCRDMSCHLRGAPTLQKRLEALVGQPDVGPARVCGVSCLGQCDRTLAVMINDQVYHGIRDAEQLLDRIGIAADGQHPPPQHTDRAPLGWKIDPYQGQARYDAVRKFAASPDADKLIAELKNSDLRGMGGAGFPTHIKWATVRKEGGEGGQKYVVCNADESEPGTFKDRELLRRAPYLVIEGMVLAALVVGADKGWIYVRHEYEEEIEVLEHALEHAREAGVIGANVLNSGKAFDLQLYVSPGGYIQGEESALLEAMEDRRGEPRNKPPFPVNVGGGLFGRPTVINNVETLSWVPAILVHGGEWYRSQGINGANGLRFVSISGDVAKPGVYEVPFGLTVGDLIFKTAGGMLDGQKLKAIAPSGPSGGFLPARIKLANLPPSLKDRLPAGETDYDVGTLPMDLNTFKAAGWFLGAAFVVVGDRANMLDMALNCVAFYRNESCGKCVPCRVGSQKLTELLQEIIMKRYTREQLREKVALIGELADTMGLTSICGLGQVAANPITYVIKHFPEEVEKFARQ